MRLICGIWMRDGQPADRERLSAMCAAMQPVASAARRGRPSFWCDGSVGLGVLTFGSVANHGILHSQAGQVIVADAQLHEPEELRRLLGSSSGEDAELLEAALDRYGVDAPKYLVGDFAVAVWSAAARQLLLIRDSAGVRPLVYHDRPGAHLLFASFPRALHASGLCPRELNAKAVLRPVLGQFDAEETLSEGVLQVAPGSTLRVTVAGSERRTYWQPTSQPRRHKDPPAAAEELRSLLDRAVRGRIGHGTGPVAAHLSGGLDSSTLAILAARTLRTERRPLLAYSFIPAEQREGVEDELPFVQSILAQERDIQWKPISPPPLADVLQAPRDVDRAFPLTASWPENAVCADAAANGADLVLSGWGGDEGASFNARGVLADAFLRGRWLYMAAEVQALKRRRGFRRRSTLLGDVGSLVFPSRWFDSLQRLRGRALGEAAEVIEFLAPEWRERLRGEPSAEALIGPNARNTQLRLLRSAHIAARTGTWATIGANYGLAFSFPLLDRRVLDWALSLPPRWHLRDGWKRRLLRDATEGILPETIRWRHGKLAPYPDGFWQYLNARSLLLERAEMFDRNPAVRAVFDIRRLQRAIRALPPAEAFSSGSAMAGQDVGTIAVVLGYSEYIEQYAAREHL